MQRDIFTRRHELSEKIRSSFEADGRVWPEVPVPINQTSALEKKIADQAIELNQRNAQIADLSNIQQQQTTVINDGCEQIDRLSRLVISLQDALNQEETECRSATEKLIALSSENDILRTRFDASLNETTELSKRLQSAEVELHEVRKSYISIEDQLSPLQNELNLKSREADNLSARIEVMSRRHSNELEQQKVRFETDLNEF